MSFVLEFELKGDTNGEYIDMVEAGDFCVELANSNPIKSAEITEEYNLEVVGEEEYTEYDINETVRAVSDGYNTISFINSIF
jgi:hypothetical protein